VTLVPGKLLWRDVAKATTKLIESDATQPAYGLGNRGASKLLAEPPGLDPCLGGNVLAILIVATFVYEIAAQVWMRTFKELLEDFCRKEHI
jgi:hypothetical protein